jgi:hypothetical protein
LKKDTVLNDTQTGTRTPFTDILQTDIIFIFYFCSMVDRYPLISIKTKSPPQDIIKSTSYASKMLFDLFGKASSEQLAVF